MDALFTGDSLIEYGNWRQLLADWRVINKGYAGETVAGLLRRCHWIADGVGTPAHVLVMIGANNLLQEDFYFIPDYGAIIECFREKLPKSAIWINSLLPLDVPWLAGETVARMNVLLKDLSRDKNTGFLDVHSRFLDRWGNARKELYDEDGVHLSPAGYDCWARVLEETLPASSSA